MMRPAHLCRILAIPMAMLLVVSLARTAHGLLGCDGITRTDFIVPADGEPRFLEINTLPGLTAASISPKAAAAAGVDFTSLIAMLIEMAREKARAAQSRKL